ncbi:unnamed protein product, partial [Menidia menidia]
SDSASEQASSHPSVSPYRETQSNLSIPKFQAANTEEAQYYKNVLLAMEKWFSLFGWPNGPHPITIPHTLRRFLALASVRLFPLNELQHGLNYNSSDYEFLSKRSWTDVLLQIYKTLASNIYSSWELKLLTWLNIHYQSMRKTVWGRDGVPPARWIVNFALDLTDGLVLAALLAAYCPFLVCLSVRHIVQTLKIKSHFQRIYTKPNSLEQILHNNIIVVQALTLLCLNLNM